MDSKLLTRAEAQQILRVSKSTMYTMLRTGEIPSIRVGHTYRIPESALDAFLNHTKNKQVNRNV